jgi:Protein of unknown function (DUF4232)
LGAVAVVAVLAAACGTSSPTAGGSGNPDQSPTTTSSPGATGASTETCQPTSLSLSEDSKQLPSASGHSAAFFAVTNTGSTTCQLSGYPEDVQVLGSNGSSLGIQVENATPGAQYMLIAPEVAPVVLAPSSAAYFGLTWTDEVVPTPSQGQSATCPSGTEVQASIAGATMRTSAQLLQLCNSRATVTALASASANWGSISP